MAAPPITELESDIWHQLIFEIIKQSCQLQLLSNQLVNVQLAAVVMVLIAQAGQRYGGNQLRLLSTVWFTT